MSGFTLLEVLIALSLTVMLMSALYGALHFSARSWYKAVAVKAHASERYLVSDWLRRQIAQAKPLPLPLSSEIQFSGEGNAVSFVAPLASQWSRGWYRLLIEWQPDEGRSLGRLILVYSMLDSENGGQHQETLLNDVESVRFQYVDENGVRFSQWSGRDSLPNAIEVDIVMADELRSWPSLWITPYDRLVATVGRGPS